MVAGKRTVFLLPETSGDLVTTANLECTHTMHANEIVPRHYHAGPRRSGCWLYRVDRVDLIWGILRGGKLNFPHG